MGSVAALVIAILSGFNQALLVGAGLYLVALFFITRRANEGTLQTKEQLIQEAAGVS
jgi:hypothetical protein